MPSFNFRLLRYKLILTIYVQLLIQPKRPRLDVCCLRSNRFDPAFESLSDELGVVIGPNLAWHASQDEQIGQCINNFGRVPLSLHPDSKAFSAVFIQDVERSE